MGPFQAAPLHRAPRLGLDEHGCGSRDILLGMEAPSLSDIARLVAEDFQRQHSSTVGVASAARLQNAIELALLTAVRGERRACIAECTRRAELWERTEQRQAAAAAPPRLEAQCRANEARYLADLLQSRGPVA
jgi:hypothetical protein